MAQTALQIGPGRRAGLDGEDRDSGAGGGREGLEVSGDQDHGLFEQRNSAQIGGFLANAGGQRQGVFAGAHAFDGGGAAMGIDLEVDFGGGAAHRGQHARPPGGEDRFGDTEGEAASVVGFFLAQSLAQRGDQGRGALEQAVTDRGQAHAAAVGLGQGLADFAFQGGDALADRRLSDAELSGGAGHGAGGGEGAERFDLVEHVIFLF